MPVRGKVVLLILCLNAIASLPQARAHDLSASYSKIALDGVRVNLQLTLNLGDLHSGPSLDSNRDGTVAQDELDESIATFFEVIKQHLKLEADGKAPQRIVLVKYGPLNDTGESWDLVADNVIRLDVQYTFDHEVEKIQVLSTLDAITQENHRLLLTFGEGDDTYQAVLDRSGPSVTIDTNGQTVFEVFAQYLLLGIEHIFTGYDHLAFLVGLLLITTTLPSLIKVVTSFTVAHSITLALATFDLVSVPSRVIESLIALSIAYIAIENFTGKSLLNRWKITFLFGLVHGFGFANVLKEMELSRANLAVSLFSFNAGVETGQLLFVAVVFPLLYYVSRTRFKEHVLNASSLAIMCLGFYWFVQRAFL